MSYKLEEKTLRGKHTELEASGATELSLKKHVNKKKKKSFDKKKNRNTLNLCMFNKFMNKMWLYILILI